METRGKGSRKKTAKGAVLQRAPTGVRGLDEVTGGGVPKGVATLVCGAAGSGKTVFCLQFATAGARAAGEGCVYLSFEESREKIARNIGSLGFDAGAMEREGALLIEQIDPAQHPGEEVGEFELAGLFLRLERGIERIGAKRVAIDGAEALIGAFKDQHTVRKELARLFRWLEKAGVTTLVTGEQGQNALTRHGFEEHLADCVIYLDHRITDQLSTRRLRVIKYRGAPHSTDEYPFFIDETGICVLPLSSLGLNHTASSERVSTGIPNLDAMFGGRGFFRGSSVLVSGTAGTGKSSIAGTFVEAACARGERAIYFAFEESQDQIVRNMRSIGLDLGRWTRKGLLRFETFRPTIFGLESHLANIQRITRSFQPQIVVIDPLTNFSTLGSGSEVKNMLMRLIDFFKTSQITALFTSLTEGGAPVEQSSVGVSSLIDTWLLVRDIEMAGERNRGLYVLKARGMAHSNQIREFAITDRGLELIPVYVGRDGNVFIGAARAAKESEEAALAGLSPEEKRAREKVRALRMQAFEAELAALQARHEAEEQALRAEEQRAERREAKAARQAEEAHRKGLAIASP